MKARNNRKVALSGANDELVELLERFEVKNYLQLTPSRGLRRLNIRLVEKVPATLLRVV